MNDMVTVLCWFDHDGGPLILLPREALPLWEGIEPPSNDRVLEAVSRWENQEKATDYDRACDVMAWAEVLPVGTESWGMVLPEDGGGITLLTLDNTPDVFAILQSLLYDTDTLVEYRSAFDRAMQERAGWTPLQDDLIIREGGLLLMHAASPGDEVREVAWNRAAQIGNAQALRVPAGSCSLDQYSAAEGEDRATGAIFTRFQRRD